MSEIRDKFKTIVDNHVDVHSPASIAIQNVLLSVDLLDLTMIQQDHLDRVLAAGLSGLREYDQKRYGWKKKRWKPGPNQPGAEKIGSSYEFPPYLHEWLDHPSIAIRDGKKVYVSEPYKLTSKAIQQLAKLIDDGWDVEVCAGRSTYFTGSTVSVEISRASTKSISQPT